MSNTWPYFWKKEDEPPHAGLNSPAPVGELTALLTEVNAKLDSLPPSVVALTAFALGSISAISTALFYVRYGKRLKNSDWITPDVLGTKRRFRGVVTSVGDADNFRFFHTPAFGGYHWPLKVRKIPTIGKELKDQTLHIRMAGVDAPEAGHFGKPAQPYAKESLGWLRKTLLGKKVYCELLRRDQYSRIVAHVYLPPRILPGVFFKGKNISLEMLRAGWGVTYAQAGAEYGDIGKDGFLRIEAEAKVARRGMWEHGVSAETPAEYKRRYSQSSDVAEAQVDPPTTKKGTRQKGWLWRLFSRG